MSLGPVLMKVTIVARSEGCLQDVSHLASLFGHQDRSKATLNAQTNKGDKRLQNSIKNGVAQWNAICELKRAEEGDDVSNPEPEGCDVHEVKS
jgi:hypothetical protein